MINSVLHWLSSCTHVTRTRSVVFTTYTFQALMMSNEKEFHLKEGAVKQKDTVLSSMVDDVTLTHFEEQKRILNTEFQDIEDRIVGFYLMTKPNPHTTKRIRQKIQKQLLPLYKMVKDSLEISIMENMVQRNVDVSGPDAKRMKTSEVNADDQNMNM